MKTIYGDLTEIEKGIICQQVNCKNAYGAGLSGTLAKKWPEIETRYRSSFEKKTGQQLFGTYRTIKLNEDLWCANIYSQYGYGNAYRDHISYTDMDKLVNCLTDICKHGNELGLTVYVPKNIGCGLAGGDWNELCKRTKDLPIIAVSNDPEDRYLGNEPEIAGNNGKNNDIEM